MGGFHTLYTTMNNPDMFNYSGMFSAAIGTGSERQAAHPEIYDNLDGKLATYFSKKPALLWIGIGKTDFLINANNEFRAKLDKAGYPYVHGDRRRTHLAQLADLSHRIPAAVVSVAATSLPRVFGKKRKN